MATELIHKSFRSMVGLHQPDGPAYSGMHVLDTNDSTRFFGFFVMADGDPESARFAADYLKNRFGPYSDAFCKREITKPLAFLKGLLVELIREMTAAGLQPPTAPGNSIAVMMMISGVLHFARCNNAPVNYMHDRRFRQVFTADQVSDGVELASVAASDHDRILLCSDSVNKRLSRAEMRTIMAGENDLDLACSKIATIANRYEEMADTRLMMVGLRRYVGGDKSVFSKKNVGIVSALALFVFLLFMGGDIVKLFQRHEFHFRIPRPSILNRVTKRGGGAARRPMKAVASYQGLSVPYDLAVADDGALFVVDDRSEKIIRINPDSSQVQEIGDALKLSFPTSIVRDGNKLYVADFSRQVNRIYRLDMGSGAVTRIPADSGTTLSNPKALALTGDGNIYLCDRGNNRILKFSPDGALLKEIAMPGNMDSPNGIAVGRDGDLFVTMKESNNVARIVGENEVKPFPLLAGQSGAPVGLDKPAGIAVDGEGYVYVADSGNRRVIMAEPSGKVVDILDAQRLKDFETIAPMSIRTSLDKKFIYVTGSNQSNFSPANEKQCRGMIWKIQM